MLNSDSVSYTHRDVYKRQDLKTFGYWENSNYEEALMQYKAYCRNSLIAVCVLILSPVSYTHLDVYKRQQEIQIKSVMRLEIYVN